MVELPTKEELEKLYHEKGHDALVWYAWRNNLRALAALGMRPLHEIWDERTAHHVYTVCRVPLILSCWMTIKRDIFKPMIADDTEKKAKPIASASAVVKSSIYAVKIAYDSDEAIITNAVSSANAMRAAHSFNATFVTVVSTAAMNDYIFLKNYFGSVGEALWSSQPLWGKVDEPSWFVEIRKQLDRALRLLDLGFLSDDLNNLFDNKKNNQRIVNYNNDWSEAITNDSSALH
ncbi:MAG: hypothetical protein JG718_16540 [Candidatus Thiothrix moscowensis]|nr:hypothetical protein [Candidatus Thiothrix moscowensis]